METRQDRQTLGRKAWGLARVLFSRWTWLMAWRDSRRSRRRLLVFSSSIVLGIGALAGIGSFGEHMEKAVEDQAKTLLGADLALTSRDELTGEMEEWIRSLGGEQSPEVSFSSMIYFPKSDNTRLAQVRALGGDFPFYGRLETAPVEAARRFREEPGVLLEESLMAQYEAEVGDLVKIGDLELPILGRLRKVPGETVAFATLAPRVFMPFGELEKTGLMGEGSLVRYKTYFGFGSDVDAEALVKRLRPQLDRFRFDADTVEERKKDLGRAMDNLYYYLSLAGFVALLLGGVGIASAIHVHIKQRLNTVAVLRCLGSPVNQAFGVYLAQTLALGLAGALAGGVLGVGVQWVLPKVAAGLLPVEIEFGISWLALTRGMVLGVGLCLLFALIPLLSVRRVSPLAAIRASDETAAMTRDPLVWVCYGLLAAGLFAFGITQSRHWWMGASFAGALLAALGILAGISKLIIWAARGRIPASWPYVWRQGLANLYRPGNRTLLLTLSLGLGTFLILTLHLAQTNLLRELFPAERKSQGNAVLFDIQPDQREEVVSLLGQLGLPAIEEAPIVTMRIQSINGRSVEQILGDDTRDIPKWTLQREYRSTYRAGLTPTEKLVAGKWHERVSSSESPTPISLEDGIAERLKLEVGDEIVFDVQGVPMATRVANLREVDWRRLHPNFFVVFPEGVLEEAPSFHVILTRVETSEESARMQREIVKRFPNVSTVDLALVLETIDSILGRISFVIRFMALFTAGTGVLVLVGALLTGRFQRVRESILLRTLGASRRQIIQILVMEYLFLGVIAALTGMILSVGASWALAAFVFDVRFAPSLWPLALTVGVVSLLTLVTGLLASRGVCTHPPLEILRSEG